MKILQKDENNSNCHIKFYNIRMPFKFSFKIFYIIIILEYSNIISEMFQDGILLRIFFLNYV